MAKTQTSKPYDLEARTFNFALDCRQIVRSLPRSLANIEDGKQLIRSSGSIGANYIEANEAFSKKDFRLRVMICRKEAKESAYWLRLIEPANSNLNLTDLIDEASQLTKIYGSIIEKTKTAKV